MQHNANADLNHLVHSQQIREVLICPNTFVQHVQTGPRTHSWNGQYHRSFDIRCQPTTLMFPLCTNYPQQCRQQCSEYLKSFLVQHHSRRPRLAKFVNACMPRRLRRPELRQLKSPHHQLAWTPEREHWSHISNQKGRRDLDSLAWSSNVPPKMPRLSTYCGPPTVFNSKNFSIQF